MNHELEVFNEEEPLNEAVCYEDCLERQTDYLLRLKEVLPVISDPGQIIETEVRCALAAEGLSEELTHLMTESVLNNPELYELGLDIAEEFSREHIH